MLNIQIFLIAHSFDFQLIITLNNSNSSKVTIILSQTQPMSSNPPTDFSPSPGLTSIFAGMVLMQSSSAKVTNAPPEALVFGVQTTFKIAAAVLAIAACIMFILWRSQPRKTVSRFSPKSNHYELFGQCFFRPQFIQTA